MRFRDIEFKNFGPIINGNIENNKINIFFGPNNSGKSLVSRFIHGVNSLEIKQVYPASLKRRYGNISEDVLSSVYFSIILNSAGIRSRDVVTFGKKSTSINIQTTKSSFLKLQTKRNRNPDYHVDYLIHRHIMNTPESSRQSVYIPAGRTGIIQFFTNITQVRNRLLGDVLRTFGEKGIVQSKSTSSKDIRKITRSLRPLAEYVEQFHNLILNSQSNLDKNIQELFSKLFEGSIEVTNKRGFPTIIYKDPSGFETDIESVGSGTLSAFPIIAGIHHVKSGGSLIIEELEAHMEPSRQLKTIEELQYIASKKNIRLIFTTHSDYVVKKLLALVNRKKIKHSDMGLYYFNRKDTDFTNIEKIDIDKTGEAEQPLFQDAIEDLITDFSE